MQIPIGTFVLAGVAAVSGTSRAQPSDELEVDWLGFAQLTAEHDDGGVSFGSDRLRFRSEASYRRIAGVVQLDVGAGDLGDSPPGTFANLVTDLYVSYDLGRDHSLRFGQYKTPLGMDFNTSGSALDITKRGIEAGLVLQRDVGLMVSARNLGAFGYDVGYFNVPGRSSATAYLDSQDGEENAFAARGHYDAGAWHAELAYGEAAEAGGPGTADYRVSDFGVRYRRDDWTAKAEWIDGRNVRGNPLRDEDAYYVHGGYALSETFELVARHYKGTSRIGASSTELSNTYLGFSWQPLGAERMNGRVQVNYVIAGGDDGAYTGVRGYRNDTVLVQFQLYAEK